MRETAQIGFVKFERFQLFWHPIGVVTQHTPFSHGSMPPPNLRSRFAGHFSGK